VILPPGSAPEISPSRSRGPAWGPLHLRLHQELLQRPTLLPRGARLLLAVSGGQDSMALTRLLLDLRRLHLWELQLWHGNHGWRPEAAAQAEHLSTWAAQQGLAIQVERADPPPSGEAAGRTWRYARLQHWASQLGCHHVVTGHTASDRAETVLLNLARGAHLRGLSSLRRLRALGPGHALVRPLLGLSRAETAAFCAEWDLPVWMDSSNDQLRYGRNRIRHQVVPVLEELHPGASRRISALAERLEHDPLEELLGLALALLIDPAEPRRLSREALGTCSADCHALLVRHWLERETGRRLAAKPVETLSRRLRDSPQPGSLDLGGGWRLTWDKQALLLEPDDHPPPGPLIPAPDGGDPNDA